MRVLVIALIMALEANLIFSRAQKRSKLTPVRGVTVLTQTVIDCGVGKLEITDYIIVTIQTQRIAVIDKNRLPLCVCLVAGRAILVGNGIVLNNVQEVLFI